MSVHLLRFAEPALRQALDIAPYVPTSRVLEAHSVILCDADDGNKIRYASPYFEIQTGYIGLEYIGRNPRFLQGACTNPDDRALFRKLLTAGRRGNVSILNYHKLGYPITNNVELVPILSDGGRPVAFLGLQSIVSSKI